MGAEQRGNCLPSRLTFDRAPFPGRLEQGGGAKLARLYPKSRGKPAVVRLDCYDTPDAPLREFVEQFTARVRESAEFERVLKEEGFITSLRFEYN
jgi:hypothetical protein